jgi:2-keto-4-pentenoate hydratase
MVLLLRGQETSFISACTKPFHFRESRVSDRLGHTARHGALCSLTGGTVADSLHNVNRLRIAENPQIRELAKRLYLAERNCSPIDPLAREHTDLEPRDAYAIQEAYAELHMADGAKLVGRKIGATSKAIQELFSIDVPDYGHIFDDMVVENGGSISRAELIQPMVEPELGFILGEDLRGPGVSRYDVLKRTRAIVPCLEIIDSRITDWNIQFVDTVADNGSSARCVFGDEVEYDDTDLSLVEAEMRHNREVAGTATGKAVLGHPAEAVAWLANALADFDRYLRADDYILSGSFMAAVRAEAGDTFEVSFTGGFGRVSCRFF